MALESESYEGTWASLDGGDLGIKYSAFLGSQSSVLAFFFFFNALCMGTMDLKKMQFSRLNPDTMSENLGAMDLEYAADGLPSDSDRKPFDLCYKQFPLLVCCPSSSRSAARHFHLVRDGTVSSFKRTLLLPVSHVPVV